MELQTVIHHSADFDGIFCREIARKFLPDAKLIGWDYGQPKIPFPTEGDVYVMDLSPDCLDEVPAKTERIIWIDHHKSAIDKFPKAIPGHRIDGVAACRLAWQWFTQKSPDGNGGWELPGKQAFIDRKVSEPLAVRLTGEYDVWDHRDDNADVAFQFGLDAQAVIRWELLLSTTEELIHHQGYVPDIIGDGRVAMRCYAKRDADVMRTRSFIAHFGGLAFLALNTPRCNSQTFSALDIPETGHEALMAFYWTGTDWSVSMYHSAWRRDLDLSKIAVKHGGGGHRGACGFRAGNLPFVP